MPLRRLDVNLPDDALTVSWELPHPRETVWSHLQNPETLREWLGRPLVFDTRIGGEIIIDHADDYLCRSEVLSVSEFESALSWTFPDEPSSRISLSLSAADPTERTEDVEVAAENATVLTLEHFGLGPLIESYATGWLTHLTFFEASLNGTPLPDSQFWPLCATVDRLIENHRN